MGVYFPKYKTFLMLKSCIKALFSVIRIPILHMDSQFIPPPLTGLTPYTGNFTQLELQHLLKRTLFGASKDDLTYFSGKTLAVVLNELLNPITTLPAPPIKEYTTSTSASAPDTAIAQGSTWVGDLNNDGTVQSQRRASFKKWWMGLMINQDRSILEKMTLFWHNHFATESNDIGNAQYIYRHHQLLRTNALGNFKVLTRAVTVDSAMLGTIEYKNSTR
ncbi:MAG: hypothetical protein B7Y11_04930 [Sphingobacteriia bacterium 24-36-13]|nr:MAG: hypothetical protein B7Y11_04930 [Sphingobacteriia bacterium 24-36-13]